MDSLFNTYLTLLKMSTNDPRYESMLFNYQTTTRQDYRYGTILDIKRTEYKEKPVCLRVRPPPLKDIQTVTDWKHPGVPIDLMVQPKEVVRSDPHKIQQAYAPLEDEDREKVRATRPRLVMTPAVSMDDIQDEHKREILSKEMYKSSAKKAMEAGITSLHDQSGNVKAPLNGTLSPANPLSLQKLQVPYVSPQWRMRGARWDGRQLRSHCDTSREFYLARTLKCKVCDETAARERDRKIMKRAKRKV